MTSLESTECLTILVLGALIGLIPAAIANSKGHSFFWWWVFGAAMFIIALPAVLLVKTDAAKLEQRQLADGTMKRCPYCAELVKQEAIVCKHCGRELTAPSAS